jgi:DNA topoisomerase-6 subunit A
MAAKKTTPKKPSPKKPEKPTPESVAAKSTAARAAIAKSLAEVDKKTLAKIQRLAQEALRTVQKGENPTVSIRTRALSNVSFNERKKIIELGDRAQGREFFNTAMARKFMQTFLVANGAKALIEQNKTISIRQMFYMSKHTLPGTNENTFEDQNESDPIIEDLEVAIEALREELHLFANRRGLLVGPLVVNDNGDEIDLARMGSGGWGIPSICEEDRLKFVRNKADFVLCVEKQAVWHRLNEDRFWEKHNCILMTSEGQAARGARRLLQRMDRELKLPTYALVDNDPWGLYIYSVIKQGSINLAYESMRMAVPTVRFLGMSSFDYKKFGLTPAVKIGLSKEDIARAEQMKAYPWFKDKKWQREIQAIVDNGFKMEVDGFLTKSVSFITEEYIPKKLKDRDWLQ